VKCCNLIGAAIIVAASTSSVYGCDKTLFTASTVNNHQKASGAKGLAMPDYSVTRSWQAGRLMK